MHLFYSNLTATTVKLQQRLWTKTEYISLPSLLAAFWKFRFRLIFRFRYFPKTSWYFRANAEHYVKKSSKLWFKVWLKRDDEEILGMSTWRWIWKSYICSPSKKLLRTSIRHLYFQKRFDYGTIVPCFTVFLLSYKWAYLLIFFFFLFEVSNCCRKSSAIFIWVLSYVRIFPLSMCFVEYPYIVHWKSSLC